MATAPMPPFVPRLRTSIGRDRDVVVQYGFVQPLCEARGLCRCHRGEREDQELAGHCGYSSWRAAVHWIYMRSYAPLLLLAITAMAESVAGLKWTAPPGWKSEGSRPMRAATYVVAPAPGDHDSAECVVYFFGTGQGGSIDANIERWKGQLHQPGGKPAQAQVRKRTVHGLPVTTVDASGEYSGMGGPMAQQPPKAGYRLLGGIVSGPGGNVFVKFTGQAKTVAANERKFDQLLESFEAAGGRR